VATLTTPVRWSLIRGYGPDDFSHPEKLEHSVVQALDLVTDKLGQKVVVLSDFRLQSENADSQHLLGRAIDFTLPGVDPYVILQAIQDAGVVTGYGAYRNEKGAWSFHIDTRTDRTPDDPAKWGAWKDRDAGVMTWQYVGLTEILDLAKKNAPLLLILIGLAALWFLNRD